MKKENTLCTTLAGKVVEFTHIHSLFCSFLNTHHKASCRTYPLPQRQLSESIPERGSLTDEGPDAVAADAAVES